MIQNKRESEKLKTKMPENEKQRHHVVQKLTEKINMMRHEILGLETNMKLSQEHARVLNDKIEKTKRGMENYAQRKKEILEHSIEMKPVRTLSTPIEPEIAEPPKEEIPKEEITVKEFEKQLKKKGFSLDDLVELLNGRNKEE